MFTKFASERPTTETFIPSVIARHECEKHNALVGMACWYLFSATGDKLEAICNKRARRFGYQHPISDASLRINNQKRHRRR